jgi:hypothetical protein
MRENETRVQQRMAAPCKALLEFLGHRLIVLDSEVGEEELIQAVAAALANLRTWM